MSTKTISIEASAYERLVAARRHPEESFSQVIRRAEWSTPGSAGAELLAVLANLAPMPAGVIAELEFNEVQDAVPADKWV